MYTCAHNFTHIHTCMHIFHVSFYTGLENLIKITNPKCNGTEMPWCKKERSRPRTPLNGFKNETVSVNQKCLECRGGGGNLSFLRHFTQRLSTAYGTSPKQSSREPARWDSQEPRQPVPCLLPAGDAHGAGSCPVQTARNKRSAQRKRETRPGNTHTQRVSSLTSYST